MRFPLRTWLSAVVVLGAVGAVGAASLTVDDLLTLKQLGYSEAEIKAEIQRAGPPAALSDADAARLTKAGFSSAMIASLRARGSAGRKLTVEAVVAMVGAGRTADEILTAIRQTGSTFQVSPKVALDLMRGHVPLAVVLAMKGQALTVADLERLAATGLKPSTWRGLVDIVGVVKTPLTPARSLALIRAGVPQSVVAQLRGRPGPAVRPVQTPKPVEAPKRTTAQPRRPTERALNPHAKVLVGQWRANLFLNDRAFGQMRLDLKPDGAYHRETTIGSNILTEAGRWKVDAAHFSGYTAEGKQFKYPYKYDGHALSIEFPITMGGRAIFKRLSAPPPKPLVGSPEKHKPTEQMRRLVGTWNGVLSHPVSGPYGQVMLRLLADGRYEQQVRIGANVIPLKGRWQVDGTYFSGYTDEGKQFKHRYEYAGGRLILELPVGQGGRTVFWRR